MVTVKLRNIGNSKGIIIPKEMIAQCNMEENVTIEVKDQQLIIRKVESPQIQWDTVFNNCIHESAEEKIDAQSMGDFPNQFDEEEWQW
jgi:antitoxin MazE